MLVRHSGSDAASASARATGKKSLPVMSASRGNGPGAAPGIPGSEPATNGDVRRRVLRPANPGLWLRGPHADSRQAPPLDGQLAAPIVLTLSAKVPQFGTLALSSVWHLALWHSALFGTWHFGTQLGLAIGSLELSLVWQLALRTSARCDHRLFAAQFGLQLAISRRSSVRYPAFLR